MQRHTHESSCYRFTGGEPTLDHLLERGRVGALLVAGSLSAGGAVKAQHHKDRHAADRFARQSPIQIGHPDPSGPTHCEAGYSAGWRHGVDAGPPPRPVMAGWRQLAADGG